MKTNNKLDELKTFFMGTPQIGADILESLLNFGVKIDTVVTRPDKPKGRGGQISESPVKQIAKENNIKLFQPLKKSELEEFVINEKPDLIIVAAFGMILPPSVFETPKYKTLNVHLSLLPKYRGAAPIEAPILAGDKETGATIMLISEGMDEGDILAKKELLLTGKEEAPDLRKALAKLGGDLLNQVLPKWIKGEITPIPQDSKGATYTKMITKEDGRIFFEDETATEIERKNRAFQPWPGTYTFWNGKKLDLLGIRENTEKLEPGAIAARSGNILIGTKEGSISVKELKLEGKNKILAQEFLRGYPNFPKSKIE